MKTDIFFIENVKKNKQLDKHLHQIPAKIMNSATPYSATVVIAHFKTVC